MNRTQLLAVVLRGEIVIVGELRGAKRDCRSEFDGRSGETIEKTTIIFTAECSPFGICETVTIYQPQPDLSTAQQESEHYRKGQHYAFFLEGLTRKGRYLHGRIGERGPKPIRRPISGRSSSRARRGL